MKSFPRALALVCLIGISVGTAQDQQPNTSTPPADDPTAPHIYYKSSSIKVNGQWVQQGPDETEQPPLPTRSDSTVSVPSRCLPAPAPSSQNPNCPPATSPSSPTQPTKPADPNSATPPAAPEQAANNFAGATEAGTQPGAMFAPNMFGDLIGIAGQRTVIVPGQFVTVHSPNGATSVVHATTTAHGVPIVGQYNGFKIADGDGPRPMDRVFFAYNGYADVNRSLLPASTPNLSVNQELVGFEKTFLDGNASFGMRLPFSQLSGFSDVQDNVLGDLSMIFKVAMVNDRQTGNVLSTGLVITAPLGQRSIELADGSTAPHPALFQPFVGGIFNLDRAYVQGFSSLVTPTDSRDPMILFNSIAAGYFLYRGDSDRLLTGIVPVAELHIDTPLTHRSSSDPIFFQDEVNITAGAYFLFPRWKLGGAVCVPLVGPRPYSVEGIFSVNFLF